MAPLPLEEAVIDIDLRPPVGMGLILMTDGIFERFTKDIMGYESFCLALYDSPELVWRMFEKAGNFGQPFTSGQPACRA